MMIHRGGERGSEGGNMTKESGISKNVRESIGGK